MKRAAVLGALVVVPRLIAFFLNENLYGDAVSRIFLAHVWSQAPHVISSFAQGGRQFGPLHIMALGALELIGSSPDTAGRLLSLVVGSLGAWPLWSLTRRAFGGRSAEWAVFGYAFWGLHLQCSTTTASEAINLTLVLATLAGVQRWIDTSERWALLGAALFLNLACATRYDSWLLVPLLFVLLVWQTRRWKDVVIFGAASMAFAGPWMLGNFVEVSDPFFPFRFIDDFHREWFKSEAQGWGDTYRWITLLFWPGTAVVTLTPPIALFGFVGLGLAWRKAPATRWLILSVLIPTALYTFRSTVLHSFVPLARFTVKEVALVLPFVWLGAQPLVTRLGDVGAKSVAVTLAAGLVAFSTWLGWFTWRRDGNWENTLRPISPTSNNSAPVRALGEVLARSPHDGVLVVDTDPQGFDDLQVGFLSGFAFEHLARRRAATFEPFLHNGPWSWLLRFDGGTLEHEGTLDGQRFDFRGAHFTEIPVASWSASSEPPSPWASRFHLYRRSE